MEERSWGNHWNIGADFKKTAVVTSITKEERSGELNKIE
jgi:hypothetical protein